MANEKKPKRRRVSKQAKDRMVRAFAIFQEAGQEERAELLAMLNGAFGVRTVTTANASTHITYPLPE